MKKDINFDMIRVLRVFLRENDKLFEMIFFAKTRFKNDKKIIIILRLTRGLEIYCHIEGKVYHSFQNERPFINLKLIFYKSERRFRNESHQAY